MINTNIKNVCIPFCSQQDTEEVAKRVYFNSHKKIKLKLIIKKLEVTKTKIK